MTTKSGQRIYQWYGTIEYATGLETNLVKIPQDMPVDRAALLSCGVIAGSGAVHNRAQVKPLNSVVVMGAGGVGMNSIQAAAISGAYPIIAADILDRKLIEDRFEPRTLRDQNNEHHTSLEGELPVKAAR